MIEVTVVRLNREELNIKTISVSEGTTLEEAVCQAGWSVGNNHKLAVWNVLADPDRPALAGDRIEILPPLTVDPMTARRLREEKNQKPANSLIHGRNGGKHRLI